MLVQNWTNSRVQLRYMDWSALKKSICMYARHARPFSYKRVTHNFCQPGVGSVNVWWTFIDNSRLLPLEVFALYPQGSFCPDHSLEGKIGCSFFFAFNSHLSMRSRGPPYRSLCSISTGGHLFFITIWRSFLRHFPSFSTWLQYPTDPVLHSLLLNRISLWCPNTRQNLIMYNEPGHQ